MLNVILEEAPCSEIMCLSDISTSTARQLYQLCHLVIRHLDVLVPSASMCARGPSFSRLVLHALRQRGLGELVRHTPSSPTSHVATVRSKHITGRARSRLAAWVSAARASTSVVISALSSRYAVTRARQWSVDHTANRSTHQPVSQCRSQPHPCCVAFNRVVTPL
ncbi:hypothetical protein M404DRAFT_27159 [Pisolithus tinctorius Marx 270]|uniref:Uncharacterized protein n=1 Tax=Pisolithus tinctorius Marx 270 TaxID=870435 RepID=A0A0C3P7D5_PISTI|nr:hypothetical protein M404DRAFT_27159 [Pisolithus tinctorius Marx 270]